MQLNPSGVPVLSIFLDPVNLVVSQPPFPDGPAEMARFLRELARSAEQMARQIDPVAHANRSGGAHRASTDQHDPGGGTW